MPDTLPKTLEKTYTVTNEMAVHFMGAEAPPVLSTPALLLWMEMTSRESIQELLQPGQDTVGVGVTLKHLAATPVGGQVRIVTRLVKAEGRFYTLEIEAFDETEKVGEASHQRAAITVAKFAERVRAKQKSA
ncbi:MAG: thioesterase family protein [Terriglobia bacterium]|jgi:predicted thioesterase